MSVLRRLPARALKAVERVGDPMPNRRFSLRALLKVAIKRDGRRLPPC